WVASLGDKPMRNTSGQSYRALGEVKDTWTEAEWVSAFSDVPASTGVCTDVIVRAYRQIGNDLQQVVHEDMRRKFSVYPKLWGLNQPDKNIDHRRVANLVTFFDRRGATLPITGEYLPGDLVTYDLGEIGLHIAIVTNIKNNDGYQIVHNACCGTKVETIPRNWKINGHYRYLPKV
ncbi:DUF1287 domain-containing protein, partial [Chamaesiphon sp. VAR_48_metabat_403]|uniref:DUF1287 domain-containing protein n=1 Tax=Chamaesiphon sp. VAR_48_metabat_403 TaxID=2964700 RepID=UPI00286E1323